MRPRHLLLFAGLVVFFVAVFLAMGTPYSTRLLVEATAYALVALGLNIQFGYGGLFNFGIMGFLMVGGVAAVTVSYPVNAAFWQSDGPLMLGRVLLAAVLGGVLVWAARKVDRLGITGGWRIAAITIAWFIAYIGYRTQIDPAAAYIESTSGWIGGFGLHPVLGWAFGGILCAALAFVIGKITLGLRSDYLAIATIGISEIVRSFVKNLDWLTRGTLTVSPVPWPVPRPADYQASGVDNVLSFIYARASFLVIVAIILVIAFILMQRAYSGPWGRMMRAIRDNHIAASSMGKNVKARQLEVFMLGSALMGIGGAILVSFVQVLDPSGYQPIDYTFLVWVMLIVGGSGNNWGAVFGALFIYAVYQLSAPASLWLFEQVSALGAQIGWGEIPNADSRSQQVRFVLLGIVITLALRYAPKGIIPEVVRRQG
jgi:branched-chain amino acid transport system permease protein